MPNHGNVGQVQIKLAHGTFCGIVARVLYGVETTLGIIPSDIIDAGMDNPAVTVCD